MSSPTTNRNWPKWVEEFLSKKSKSSSDTNKQQQYLDPAKITNLVFKGGSVKGVAYVGSLSALESIFASHSLNLRLQIINVGGTSAGAITALLFALNYSMDEFINYLINTDLKSFLVPSESRVHPEALFKVEDASMLNGAQMLAGALMDLNSKFGLYSGNKFLEWIESIVKGKTGIDNCTFEELHQLIVADKDENKLGFKDLHVVGFNLSSNLTKVFNYTSSPDTVIADAVRISMSIPIIFLPHNNYVKKKKSESGSPTKEIYNTDMWVDGGLTNNYPVRIFDSPAYNEATLGFYFVSPEELSIFELADDDPSKINCIGLKREIKTGFDYARALFESVIDSQQMSSHLESRDPERTVYINHLNISGLNFGLSVEEKQNLVVSGWEAVYKKFGYCSQTQSPSPSGSPNKNKDKMAMSMPGPGPIPSCPIELPVTKVEVVENEKTFKDKCTIA